MEQYNVTGMSCAACSSRVEKAVSRVPGVTSCSVSLLTNSMGVEGTAGAGAIIKAVQDVVPIGLTARSTCGSALLEIRSVDLATAVLQFDPQVIHTVAAVAQGCFKVHRSHLPRTVEGEL